MTHRGCHINAVLSVSQYCEYVATRVGDTQDRVRAILTDTSASVCRCGCSLQHKGSKVEKHSYEMVKHILRKRRKKQKLSVPFRQQQDLFFF